MKRLVLIVAAVNLVIAAIIGLLAWRLGLRSEENLALALVVLGVSVVILGVGSVVGSNSRGNYGAPNAVARLGADDQRTVLGGLRPMAVVSNPSGLLVALGGLPALVLGFILMRT